jgi:hypothetical protein
LADLLFFPTGGGKTEAYLGLAAFTIAHRRLIGPGVLGAGVAVIMRYTLRLLTLDQLARAAGVVCALELMRDDPTNVDAKGRKILGDWPIEIGLWVGSDASPNRLGRTGDGDKHTAVGRIQRYRNGQDKRAPAPLKACPWCGTEFTPASFACVPNNTAPTNMEIRCANTACDFTPGRALPVLTVDEPIYRRLPAFLIATVDKFASLPWLGETGAFFGNFDRFEAGVGFFGAAEPSRAQRFGMSKNTQRLSRTVSTFGPGSMVDLPTRSIVVGGLNQWDMRSVTVISEPRLTARLERLLREQNRLADGIRLQLRVPPISDSGSFAAPDGIRSFIFPKWFVCERTEPGSTPIDRRRRLVPWQDLAANGRRRYAFDDGKASDVTPIRFVCACEKGHLQDIDWRRVVHGPDRCQEPMWVEEKGTSADPADTAVICACGKRLSLQDLFQPGRLGTCAGERPWLLDRDPNGCGEKLKLLTRTATNTYFPQVLTVISLPAEEDALSAIVQALEGVLKEAQSAADIAQAKKYNPSVASALRGYAAMSSTACNAFVKGPRHNPI